MRQPLWVKLPSRWIETRGLCALRWRKGEGADNVAALMTLMAIAHRIDRDTGIASATYDALCAATSLSRSMLSAGITVLEKQEIIERAPEGRSTYRLAGFDPGRGWAMLPVKGLCDRDGQILAFKDLHLRKMAELDALKLYFLFVARRDRDTNMAHITYSGIEDYTGVERNRITAALSVLATHGLIYVDRLPSRSDEDRYANAYRLRGLESYNHAGTRGRGDDGAQSRALSGVADGDAPF